MPYIWEEPGWPRLRFDRNLVQASLKTLEAGRSELIRQLHLVGFETRREHYLDSLSSEVLESSLIESEVFSAPAVRSSIARKLGIDPGPRGGGTEKRAEGIIQVLLEATRNYQAPLTERRLLDWHRQLLAHDKKVLTGAYRNDPVTVESGAFGRETVHFEGPPPERVGREMNAFFEWLEQTPDSQAHPWVKSSLAHFWFVTIHPFEDGNGRLARAIGEHYLARADDSAERYYSVSSTLNANRKAYYEALETSQKGSLDISRWMLWSLNALEEGIRRSTRQVVRTITNGEIWRKALESGMNPRQKKMLPKLLAGFEGPLTTQKWAAICQCSQDTATRDIAAWLELGILERSRSGGRSTHYAMPIKLE